MNKYEEAFTAMATFVNLQGCIDSRKVYVLKQIETISELVDKSTPKKLEDKRCPECLAPINKEDEMLPDYPGIYQCPECEHPTGGN